MSPAELAFDIVDVFAESPFAGNQLAVVHGADALTDAQRLAVAREFGYSETTFPSPDTATAYAVRILTPSMEIPFAGHPTLGTAWVLRERGEIHDGPVTQRCAAGDVGVTFSATEVELTATPRDLAGPLPEAAVHALIADHGLGPDDVAGEAWLAGCGLNFVHLPVTEEALVRARLGTHPVASYDGLPEVGDGIDGLNLVALAAGDPLQVHSRVFVPGPIGAEDAATGSAAAGLGMALVAARVLADGGAYAVRQGVEMGRPSRLTCHVEADAGVATACRVAGRVQPIARGTLRVPPL